MKKISLVFLFVCSCIFLNAQQDSIVRVAKNSFFVELGGNASGLDQYLSEDFSINYDRLLHYGRYAKTSIRIGSNIPRIGHTVDGRTQNTHVIPVMFNVLIGKKTFMFEFGGGIDFIFLGGHYKVGYRAITGNIGLRYQSKKPGIMAKAGFTPTFGVTAHEIFLGFPVGVSIGYSF